MNFELLDSMTPEEANAALDRFVGIEKLAIEAMRGLGCADGFLHYGLESLAENLKWFLTQVRIKNVPIPLTEPEWVREGHKKGIQEFEEDCKPTVLHAGYFLGESFVQANKSLKWAIGNPESIHKNMPVVKGFRLGHELPALMVVENLFLRILADGAAFADIDMMIRTWRSRLP